jgi:hypothetical protein
MRFVFLRSCDSMGPQGAREVQATARGQCDTWYGIGLSDVATMPPSCPWLFEHPLEQNGMGTGQERIFTNLTLFFAPVYRTRRSSKVRGPESYSSVPGRSIPHRERAQCLPG